MKTKILKSPIFILQILICFTCVASLNAQVYKWMSAGSLHNWFSEMGCEIESGRPGASQQDGLQWPANLGFQDSQCQKGLWIGAKDFTDETGTTYGHKVVHVGPRTDGIGEFFPISFDMISKFQLPKVLVDGVDSYGKSVVNDEVDPSIPADRMIVNVTNTQLGITMTRKILQFSHQSHDNYMIYEYTFTNTGNVDGDDDIELPNNTVEEMYCYFQYRYAPCQQPRFVIGNDAGWGINTMNNARGDGANNIALYNDPPDEQFRAQYSWHGYWSGRTPQHYDNIGGPIWETETWALKRGHITEKDTVGRLAAPQFVGNVTLHADDPDNIGTDSPDQPSTTNWLGSNDPRTMSNSAYNESWMLEEYEIMSSGYMTPRHAWAAEPTGNFAEQQSEIITSAGFSFGNGYGPYTLGPGESITIIMAEGANGLSTEKCIEIGRQYKQGVIDAKEKNTWVLTGEDSLFKTFRLAIDNYQSGYTIADGPKPPKTFNISGGGDRIQLSWEVYENDPNLLGFRIYRNAGNHDDPFEPAELIYEASVNERNYNDLTPVRGVGYYYYIVAVNNDGLISNRHYTQSFDPAFLVRPAGKKISDIRVVPNPYILSSSVDRLRFPGEPDKLAFFNIPGQCTIQIYTEIGELIYTMEHTDGSGDDYWNAVTSSNQVVVSGIYIAIVTDNISGKKEIVKFVIIR